jgi:hypothetical protein
MTVVFGGVLAAGVFQQVCMAIANDASKCKRIKAVITGEQWKSTPPISRH